MLHLCILGFFALAETASAEMIFKSAIRSVLGDGTQLDAKKESNEEAIGSFSEDILSSGYVRDDNNAIIGSVSASASQTSSLTPSQIRGLGRGSGFGSGPSAARGLSDMSVSFTVDEPMRFTLSGQLRIAPHGLGLDLNGSSAMVQLMGPEGVAMEVRMDEANQPNALGLVDFTGLDRLSGEFPAGEYTLMAMSEGHGSDGVTRCADFDFTLTAIEAVAIPEPTTMSMFAIGLASVHFLRRRRR